MTTPRRIGTRLTDSTATGSTRPDQAEQLPHRPTRVVDSIADLVALVAEPSGDGV